MHGGINRNYFYPESFVGNSARKFDRNFPRPNPREQRGVDDPRWNKGGGWDTKWNATSFPFIPRPLPHWSVPQLVAIKRTRDAQPAAKTIVKRLVSVGHDGRMDEDHSRKGSKTFNEGMNKESRGLPPPLLFRIATRIRTSTRVRTRIPLERVRRVRETSPMEGNFRARIKD